MSVGNLYSALTVKNVGYTRCASRTRSRSVWAGV